MQGALVESLCGSISLNRIAVRSHDFAKADQTAAGQEERYRPGLVLSVCCVLSVCSSDFNQEQGQAFKKIFGLDWSV